MILAACSPDQPVVNYESNCVVRGNALFINLHFDIYHSNPRRCPVLFTYPVWLQGGGFVWYQATQQVAAGTVPDNTLLYLDIHQADGHVQPTNHPLERWGNTLRADIDASYNAGTVEPPCLPCTRDDRAVQTVFVPGQGTAQATVMLPYRASYHASIQGPGSVGYGAQFTLQATVNELALQPVTYEWFAGGQSAGPASQSASSFSDYGTHAGENQIYEVLVTDAEGARVRSDPFQVFVAGGGGGGCEPWMIECE